MRARAAILGILLAVVTTMAVRADDVWSALVLATNEHPAKPAPKDLAHYVAGLKTVFGYNTFYLLGDKKKQIRKGDEQWIVPTKKVFLKLRCVDRTAGTYKVHLELYLGKQLIVTSEVKLARGAPLYIRGPAWGHGRLIFILEVR